MGTKIKPSNLAPQVETRITNLATANSLDSSEVIGLVNSSYVRNLADSSYVQGIANSDYVKGFVDSDYVKGFVDSDHVSLKIGYTPLNKSGDTMTGTLNAPTLNATTALQINGVSQFSLGNSSDIAAGDDLNDQSYRNSVFYSLNPTNKAYTNNGVGLYISTYGMGGSSDNAADERAAQIYFGDTPASGLFYRVKQGTSGWHPWVGLGKGIQNILYDSTAAHTSTTSQSGFTLLEKVFYVIGGSSKFLIIATINGSANDDAHGRIEYYNGSSWTDPIELRGDGNTGNSYANGSFGDYSIVRSGVVEDKQTVQYTATLIHAPNKASGEQIGYRVRMSAENTNGFTLNRPMGWDNNFNSNTSRSSIIIMEITGGTN